MTEIKVQVDDELLTNFSQRQLEQFLQEMVEQLQLKAAARDALGSLEEVDIANDPQWKQARERAWQKRKQADR
ncbi:MAG: hypothetical protein WA960_11900 [Tunicatimonas sp.]|jgi:hypothetical protein